MSGELDKLINSTELIKINKIISYLSFIVKEMILYSIQNTQRNIPYYLLREVVQKISSLKEKNEKLRVI